MKRPVRARFGGNRPHTNIRTCMAMLAIPTPPTPLIATIIIFLREYKTRIHVEPVLPPNINMSTTTYSYQSLPGRLKLVKT